MQTTTGITSGNQLLKWVGNKQRMASEIIRFFPDNYATYFEPFLGSGAVLGTLAPRKAIASDILAPLMGIWELVRDDPETLIAAYAHYRDRIEQGEDKRSVYAEALQAYNAHPNSKDFIFLSRACYGGVIRFRRKDGAMSTPVVPICRSVLPRFVAGLWLGMLQFPMWIFELQILGRYLLR